jgi:predicted RNase H-like HicB family nuclease
MAFEIGGRMRYNKGDGPEYVLEDLMRSFAISLVPEKDLFIARCPELGVTSQGKSIAEAEANIKEAIELYIESFGLEDMPQTPVKPLWTTVEIG